MSGKTNFDWQWTLRQYLINSGLSGRKFTEIIKRLQNHAKTEEIKNELEMLLSLDKVQKFNVSPTGRPSFRWRATTKILDGHQEPV